MVKWKDLVKLIHTDDLSFTNRNACAEANCALDTKTPGVFDEDSIRDCSSLIRDLLPMEDGGIRNRRYDNRFLSFAFLTIASVSLIWVVVQEINVFHTRYSVMLIFVSRIACGTCTAIVV